MTRSGKPDYSALDLPPPPDDRPYVIVNMVMSVDGKVVIEGTERGLGSDVDQRLMRELRVNADVVLNGAGTLRASGTSSRIGDEELEARRIGEGRSRHPTAAVISRSGALPLDRAFFTARDFDAIVYVSADTPPERRAAIAATGRRAEVLPAGDEIAAMLAHMRRDLGANVLLVEGGPHLNGELFQKDAVDELFITLGPLVVGGARMLTAVETETPPSREGVTRLALVTAAVNDDTGELYLRYRSSRS